MPSNIKKSSNIKMCFELKPVLLEHRSMLLEFELKNKDWFEQFVPARSEHFLTQIGMSEAVALLIGEMENKTGAYFIAINEKAVIARFNFTLENENEAELGFRVAKEYGGRGVATYAILQLLPKVKLALGVSSIIAQTATNNFASNRVLKKCGFNKIQTPKNEVQLHGHKIELVKYKNN